MCMQFRAGIVRLGGGGGGGVHVHEVEKGATLFSFLCMHDIRVCSGF